MGAKDPRVDLELLRMFVGSRRRNIPMLLFFVSVLTGCIAMLVPLWQALLWVGVTLFVIGCGQVLCDRFEQSTDADQHYYKWLGLIGGWRVCMGALTATLLSWAWDPSHNAANLTLVLLIALNLKQYLGAGWTSLTIFSLIAVPVLAAVCGIVSRREKCRVMAEPHGSRPTEDANDEED